MEVGKGYVVWRVGGRGSILKRGIKIPLRGRKNYVCTWLELLKILLFKDSYYFSDKFWIFFCFLVLKIEQNWKNNKFNRGLRRRMTLAVVCNQNFVKWFWRKKDEVKKLFIKMAVFLQIKINKNKIVPKLYTIN